MNRGNSGYRRGRGGHRGHRTGSNSDSSNGYNQNRPILRPSPASQGHDTPPEQSTRIPAWLDSPGSPAKQQSSFTMNGHQINETYTERPVDLASASRHSNPPSPAHGNNQHRNGPGGQRSLHRPLTKDGEKHWAYQQERKIKIIGMPKTFWTKDVYLALSPYGTVVRIEIQQGAVDNNAYVTFRPPPNDLTHQRIRVGTFIVNLDELNPSVTTIASPLDTKKQYYEFNILSANSIDFGIKVADMSMIAMHTVESHGGIQMTLNLKRKELDIQFPLKFGNQTRKFRFRLPISLLSNIYKVSDPKTGQTTLIIPFDSSPQFFIQKNENEEIGGLKHTSFSRRDKIWNDWDTWFRETDIVRNDLKDLPLMDQKDKAIIDMGRWTSYRFSFDEATFNTAKFKDFSNALADYGVVIEDRDQYSVKEWIASPLWSLLQDEISGTHPYLEPPTESTESQFNHLVVGQIHLSFPIRYQLEACLSNGYLKEHNITREFLERLLSMDLRHAIYLLEKVCDKQHTYYNPMDIFDIRSKDSLEKKMPNYCILQRSATITPTMIHVASPIMETSNRITRKYATDSDQFIRIKFSDERNEGVLRNMPNDRAEAVFDRVRRAMKYGIVVAGRFYEFLAFGNSQFREHGAYFYAPTSSKSADDIRMSLGRFDHIKTVAKFGARLGQCFSTTRAMSTNVKTIKIPDIERNGYNFSDGVGKISLFLAQMAAQELGLSNPFDDPPPLVQFRLGGCKGVLALDPTLTGSEVHIRPSQQKFEAESKGLEIIRSSALATPFFNRQIIIVLSNLGVPDHVFIRKQQDMVNDYEHAMIDEDIALVKLRKHIDMNQTTLTMAGMVLDGFMKTRDPFMMSLLKLWRAYTIKNLKEKARIAIDDGAFVLGCVDETATLKGHMDDPQSRLDATRDEKLATLPEIFLQVDDTNKKGHYRIVEGICILARNPSLHPGDIRVVRAVDVPALHHLRNVVVLPQTGDRDLANMCSGGDLDGDDYMVLWDSDLLPETINVPPMDFTPERPIETDQPITIADVSAFFVTYMKNDSLGQIAHAHLAQADFNAEGVSSDICLDLAKLHSQAVDYPKSGIPAVMDRELRPSKWPHFMEKKHIAEIRIYKSRKILGMLFDQVQLVDFKPHWGNAFDNRILGAFENDESLLKKAAEIKLSYDESLKRLMAKHGIRTEFEAWSVFVLAHNHESRDYKFAEEFGRTIGALKAQYKETCRAAAEMTNMADWNRLGPFVAAMYTVTAAEMDAALKECHATKIIGGQEVPVRAMEPEHMPLISFPWLFPSELGKIATGATVIQRLEPVETHQEPSHRHKKNTGATTTLDVGVGAAELGGSRTNGALLELEFDFASKEQKEDQKQEVLRDVTVLKQDHKPAGRKESLSILGPMSTSRVPPASTFDSLSPPVTKAYNWKRDAK
ncbi:RdRP-domain-containing protein [Cucurbitaria berberidis CBS 394.84]|uniref:RNA-dependent RNA polymerase n=1 Tax=Cucurbitaria berberidis CBS 394.84 TaxID=1168544 RepID=A0A9P4G9H5_9PLEO|nr:RdRP-domain-containing protein [Cucurbitaria berberidis CBS 394.84]KAF1841623.1 RdRP-domain-containing protein [Cucurbitaria berberidis CBS 394.84]